MERISDYLDDRLSVEERARVEAHLRENPDDRAQLVEFTEMQQALRNAPRYELDSGFAERVLDAIERPAQAISREPSEHGATKNLSKPPTLVTKNWRYTAAMVASLAAILLLSAFLLPNDFRTDELARVNTDTDSPKIQDHEPAPQSVGEKMAEPDQLAEASLAEDSASPPMVDAYGGALGALADGNGQQAMDFEAGRLRENSRSQRMASDADENFRPEKKIGGFSRAPGQRSETPGPLTFGRTTEKSVRISGGLVKPELVMVISPEQYRNRIENFEKRWGLKKESQATEEVAEEEMDAGQLADVEDDMDSDLEAPAANSLKSRGTQLSFIVDATEDQFQLVLDSIDATRVQNKDEFIQLSRAFTRDEDAKRQEKMADDTAEADTESAGRFLSGELLQGVVIRRVNEGFAFSESTIDKTEPSSGEPERAFRQRLGSAAEPAASRGGGMEMQLEQQETTQPRRRYLLVIQMVPDDAGSVTPPSTDSENLPPSDKSSTDQSPQK